MDVHWDDIVDVIVVGDGCAGAVTAICAREEGANVLVIEKQPKDSHFTTTAMSGGSLLLPRDEGAIKFFECLFQMPGGLSWVEPDIIRVYVEYGLRVKDWIEKHGGHIRDRSGGVEYTELAGHEAFIKKSFAGKGLGLQRFLDSTLRDKRIPVSYNTQAKRLITEYKVRVIGVEVESNGESSRKTVKIGASKGVVLACGGFEYNERMILNYLPVHPTYFKGQLSATGDGIKMSLAVGADLWHMNCVSGSLGVKFPDFPIALGVSLDGTSRHGNPDIPRIELDKRPGYIIVDSDGKRFTNEDFKKGHAVYYELANFDTHRMVYPRVPCFWIMDRRRFDIGRLLSKRGIARRPQGYYEWSRDNSKELEKGWIVTSSSIRELAHQLGIPPDNLEETINTYNRYCFKGKDPEFGREVESLISLDAPPFFAIKLWPCGTNTQGGPRRNARCQVLNVDGEPIPGLYSAGEMGSLFGMLYPGGGSNLAECMAMGRVAGENVAHERPE